MQAKKDFKSLMKGKRSPFLAQTISSLKYTYAREGVQGLFKGLLPNLLGVIPSRAIYFGTYGTSKNFYTSIFGETSVATPMMSAATSIIVVTTVMNPVFFVKTRMQLEETKSNPRYTSYAHCFRRILKEEGYRAFWRGLTASWLGVSEGAIFFALYEKSKRAEAFREQTDRTNPKFNPFVFLSLSAGCKLLASASTYPHEVIRTRLREHGHGGGLVQTFKAVAHEEGWRGLYSGMGAHLMRVIPSTAIMFCVVEFVLNTLTPNEPHFEDEIDETQ
eukprot:CAMPEP_0117454266 /NCGR_PEP_ID=MMETSP0759-20121206/10708_1 /TAXON_ID=63605 /ORGANISM="Percolomonas cosmopolitus, Strain WS" /LENGTH=274 /DNA_ID=CAMNT_0005247439 /DNA_START=987 /DNA_END=1811 /DNA_ORIENTATION=-